MKVVAPPYIWYCQKLSNNKVVARLAFGFRIGTGLLLWNNTNNAWNANFNNGNMNNNNVNNAGPVRLAASFVI